MQTAAIALTLVMLTLLWWSDPKRRRAAKAPASAQPLFLRRFYLIAALLPGIVLVLQGEAAGFLLMARQRCDCWLGDFPIPDLRVSSLLAHQSKVLDGSLMTSPGSSSDIPG